MSVTVFSLATFDPYLGEADMNVVTYAMPTSLPDSQQWAVSMYRGTVSERNMRMCRRGVLQFLTEDQADLVDLLGRSSRRDVDKIARLRELGHELVDWQLSPVDGVPDAPYPLKLLAGCVGFLPLTVESIHNAGDHDLCLCRAESFTRLGAGEAGTSERRMLTTGYLRAHGLL